MHNLDQNVTCYIMFHLLCRCLERQCSPSHVGMWPAEQVMVDGGR